jgi:hypothetical protein
LELLISGTGAEGLDFDYMKMAFDGGLDLEEYRKNVVLIFYKVGLVGLKTEASMPVSWSFAGGVSVSKAEINDSTKLCVHKTFWRCLGIASKLNEE